MLDQVLAPRGTAGRDDARAAGALSIAYMMAIAGKVLRTIPLDLLDLVLVTTIANANAARPPEPPPKSRGAARKATAPDPGKIGISRNAVSRLLNVPLETVRRRVASLLEKKILLEQADGLVFTPDNSIGLGNNADLQDFNLEALRQLFRGLKASGIRLD